MRGSRRAGLPRGPRPRRARCRRSRPAARPDRLAPYPPTTARAGDRRSPRDRRAVRRFATGSTHDDVHAVPPKPCALVEAVLRAARQPDLADQIEDRSLGRRAAGRKTEQHGLANVLVAEAPHLSWHANVERRATRRAGHRDERSLRTSRPVARGRCDRVHRAARCPTTTGERQRDPERGKSPPPRRATDTAKTAASQNRPRARIRAPGSLRRARCTDTRRADAAAPQQTAHGAATSRSCSMRAGPIPGIASSSSSELKAPCFWR